MKRSDLSIMMTVACTTATLTMASFWATSLEADPESEGVAPPIATPKLVAKGVEFTLSHALGTPKAGDEPVFELAAVNTSADPADLKVGLAMTAISPGDALSRVVRMPRKLWECDQSIVLQPGEHKTFSIATATKLPDNNLITVSVSEAGSASDAALAGPLLKPAQPSIALLNFSTSKGLPTVASVEL